MSKSKIGLGYEVRVKKSAAKIEFWILYNLDNMDLDYQEDLEELLEFVELVDDVQNVNMRASKRYLRDAANPFEIYNNEQFKRRYRFSKEIAVTRDLQRISQQSVSIIIKEGSIVFVEQLVNFVKLPATEQNQRQNTTLFWNVANFPGVAGCIDCTNIPISSPG
ncbi:hypothetical protein ABEB36_009316 [Hypothenemus hampei]|uniref:Uncharacterized protein n=1 Tax=Hypothenemus hampei TaxID=57062 RepID=A0ABD1EG75_HYPHA